jgi:cytochrome o ubiquinol oxidase subunit IV
MPDTAQSHRPTLKDHVPGVDEKEHGGRNAYLAGLGFAIILTLASFWVAETHEVWGPAIPVLLAALAIGQMGVHVVFFFHISTGPDDTNNFLALAFGIFVVGLVVFGSMLIMWNLNANMAQMSMEHIMQMQR